MILDAKYKPHWERVEELTSQGPVDLITIFEEYLSTLTATQGDTYTNPFEIVTSNFGKFPLISYESFHYEAPFLEY